MWNEALSLLDRADRLHRRFFTHAAHAWEPPVDVIELPGEVRMHVALPGVDPESITLSVDAGGLTISALRAFPCREGGSHIHRIEIPYGRFERRIPLAIEDAYPPLELAEKSFRNGILTLGFHKKESR
jgi:HSP20 family molecular chaperone IbpA